MDDEPVKDSSLYISEELNGDCSLDPDKFKNILEQDLEAQIKCLDSKFKQFNKYVRTADRTVIDQGELQDFVRKFFAGNADTIIQGLGLIFELNMLLLRDEAGSISKDNITPLFQLLIKVNQEAMIITRAIKDIIEDKDGKNFWRNRTILKESISRFSRGSLSIITLSKKFPKELNIKTFLLDLEQRLGIKIDSELIDSFIFIKRLFLGGEKENITSNELVALINKAPKLIMMAIDISFASEKNFETSKKFVDFYKENVLALENLLSPSLLDSDEVFNIDGVFKAIRRMQTPDNQSMLTTYFENALDLDDYELIILRVKTDLIGGHKHKVNFKEFKRILAYAHILFDTVKLKLDYDEVTKDIEGLNYDELLIRKKTFLGYVDDFSKSIHKIISKPNVLPNEIYLLNFITELTNEIPEIKFDIKLIESLLSVKKLTIGGTKPVLTNTEVLNGVQKLNSAAELFFDSLYIFSAIEENKGLYKFGLTQISSIKNLLHTWDEKELIMPVSDILYIVEKFMKDVKASQFEPTILAYKEKILRQNKEPDYDSEEVKNISFGDITKLLSYATEGLETLLFAEITYDHPKIQSIMASTEMLPFIKFPEIEEYKQFSKERLKVLKYEFEYIGTHYRYFPDGDTLVPYYSTLVNRNKSGYILNNLLRFALNKVKLGYSTVSPNDSNLDVITIELLEEFLVDSKSLLEEFGLWTSSMSTFARNVILLGDLFQNQADGDNMMNIDESVEFVGLILTSVMMTDKTLKKMSYYCKPIQFDGVDNEDDIDVATVTYDSDCYRKNYFKVALDDLQYKKYFPKLAKYIKDSSEEEIATFHKAIETFARDSQPEEAIGMRDATLVIGAMLNIESTFVRFDLDNDNIISKEELDKAFGLYEESIMIIAGLGEDKRKYSKSILFYMVNYMAIPTEYQVVKYHYLKRKKINARRVNIGSLLKNLIYTKTDIE
jgi:hypothetical protein